MFLIRKKFKFEAAHILDSSFSKCCQRIHGHSYIVEIFVQSDTLNEDGMVIDFGELKKHVQPLIDSWDHSLILSRNSKNKFTDCDVRIMDVNPTAENMAKFLFDNIADKIGGRLSKVRVHETDTGYAEYWR